MNKIWKIFTFISFLTVIIVLSLSFLSNNSRGKIDCHSCNVVYISVDPLNAERMSLYGNERNTTPNIDQLAEKSYVFHRAFSQSSHTKPSLYSTFSSTYVSQHGFIPGEEPSRNLTLLPEVMEENGYRTISSRNSKLGKPFSPGFEVDSRSNVTMWQDKYDKLERDIENSDRKFFLFVHSFKPHDPYFNDENYTEMYGPQLPDFRNKTRTKFIEYSRNSSSGNFYPRYRDYYFSQAEQNETRKRYIVSQYDGSVRRTDRFIGRVIDLLKEKDEYKNSIIIINSQHGEQFGSQGYWWHDTSLYNEVVNIPLIVHLPEQEERVDVGSFVENIDLAPTITELVSDERDGLDQWEGKSLVPLLKGEEFSKEFVLAERGEKETAFIDIGAKIKYYNSTHGEEFYNLESDFEEENALEGDDRVRKRFGKIYSDIESKSVNVEGVWPYFKEGSNE
jgi:arylsulfatase A-like enzyme